MPADQTGTPNLPLRLRQPAVLFGALAGVVFIVWAALMAALLANLGAFAPAEALTMAGPAAIAALVLGLRLRRFGLGGLARVLTEAALAGLVVGAMWPLSGLLTDHGAGARIDWAMASRLVGLGAVIGTAASVVAAAVAAQLSLHRPNTSAP